MSLELLGADPRGILIRVKNTNALVAQQGGTGGKVAAAVADNFPDLAGQPLETVVLSKMAGEFQKQLLGKGVIADVAVVSASAHRPATSGFKTGLAAGLGLAGLGWLGWRFFLSKLF